ncbi:hypothetical protein [Streptomyces sp. NPDC059460]|uniref:hypothetical protein n=1 Tax=Streptomyces sp. NPDC059460 TaxID=3346840 RepID=UPI0036B7DF40
MTDPPVQRAAGYLHLPAERIGVLTLGQLPCELPALTRRELRVDQILDQAIAEQAHLPGPLRPATVLVLTR